MSGGYVLSALCFAAISLVTCEISCRNEAGASVDWFVVYKLPIRRINATAGPGLEYLYLDSTSQTWEVSRFLINMSQGAVGRTLQQLYQSYNTNDTAYMMYNDSPPGTNNYTTQRGHSKASQLLYYNPNAYNCSVPDLYHKELWSLLRICQGKSFPWIETTRLVPLESAQGEVFLNFAKSKYFVDADIYAAWIAQKLGSDLLSETWQPAGMELPSNCSLPRHVYNIKRLALPKISFYSLYDHSKWCVSKLGEDAWTCIGDLNRYPAQKWRSGGFICTQNAVIYRAFSGMVAYYKACQNSTVYTDDSTYSH
ncbi:deoxyribonuclease-2-beta isoform X3 [Pseudophryne corroboree]|uniref:deoxyribonuclease-2-beta isoform X3 n=1 Tax=Pseudophryne corroboree TaxID=495146 RepID=UPI0030813A8B